MYIYSVLLSAVIRHVLVTLHLAEAFTQVFMVWKIERLVLRT